MQKIFRILITSFFIVATVALVACASPPAEENKNANTPVRSQEQSNSSEPKVLREGTPAPQVEGPGDIEVNSDPPGAQVLLIEEDDGGASPPKPHGVTPAKITGLAAGKYAVHLEKPGYKPFQKNVKVVPNQTVKVNTKLKKE